jgi:hypothetical protein
MSGIFCGEAMKNVWHFLCGICGSGDGAEGVFHDLHQASDFGDREPADDYSRPTLEMLVTLPSGGAASLAASAACPLLI